MKQTTDSMEKTLFRLLALAALLVMVCSCATVPVTGRKQLSLVPAPAMLSMSSQQYGAFLQESELSTDAEKTAMVREVGENIQRAVERYYAQRGMARELTNFDWEFNLIESDEINAWAMPGGKIAVYTGMLPVAGDENGLAVVIAHEIGHAVAGHGGERMSHLLVAQMGGMALSVALADRPQATRELWMAAFGLGAQIGFILPYSRLQEREADRLGLIFMAMAGYDPAHALSFWERLSAEKEGRAPPVFLSTHPSDAERMRNIRSLLPEAYRYYEERR